LNEKGENDGGKPHIEDDLMPAVAASAAAMRFPVFHECPRCCYRNDRPSKHIERSWIKQEKDQRYKHDYESEAYQDQFRQC